MSNTSKNHNVHVNNWKNKNPEKVKQYRKKSYDSSGRNVYLKNWVKKDRKKHPDKYRSREYKRHYGITLEEYNELFFLQEGCCAICGRHQSELTHKLFIDHNHITKKIRELLCYNCNTAIGLVWEREDILERIIEYLKKHTTQ